MDMRLQRKNFNITSRTKFLCFFPKVSLINFPSCFDGSTVHGENGSATFLAF